MGRAKEIQRIQAYTLQNMYYWGLENVAVSMLTIPEADGYSMDSFNARHARFVQNVLNPMTGGRWIRFIELQKRGAPHEHLIHYAKDVRKGQTYDPALGKGRDGWVKVLLSGSPLRAAIRQFEGCREYGFGWNSTEPLRGTDTGNVEAAVNYLLKYLVKARYVGRQTILKRRRLVSYGQGCIERHGCRFDARFPVGHEKRWLKSTPALYETIRGSVDSEKRMMRGLFCQEVGIQVDDLGPYAESLYPHLPSSLAIRQLWRDKIMPMYRDVIAPF